jgi:hypothetical protein
MKFFKMKTKEEINKIIDEWADICWDDSISPRECCGDEVIDELKQKLKEMEK